MVVEVAGRRLVLERFALHDVAPVAGRVADAQEDRPVEQLRPGQRVGPPRRPVDRVVGVLEEVRAGLARESVGHWADGTRGLAGSRRRRGSMRRCRPMSAVPGFLPSTHGLHFANRFPPGPTVRLGPFDTRWFAGVGDAANGLCGGMAWYVRERFEAGLPIPPDRGPAGQRLAALPGAVRRQVLSLEWLRTPLGFWWMGARGQTTRPGGPATANARRSRPRSRRATWRWSAWSASRA